MQGKINKYEATPIDIAPLLGSDSPPKKERLKERTVPLHYHSLLVWIFIFDFDVMINIKR